MSEHSDIDSGLVRRAKSGDKMALPRLLYACDRTLRIHLSNQVPREFAAIFSVDDIVQETCLRVQQKIETLDSDCPRAFAAWVHRIADNLLRSEIRAIRTKKRGGDRKKIMDTNDSGDYVTGLCDGALTPGHVTELNEVIVAVQFNVGELSTTQRRAVQLHHIEKQTLAETATKLDKTPGELRGILDRAIRRMRAAMGTSSKWFWAK
jgi:RNA polymerase sigma factor (sigma-70 family)